MPVLRKDLSKNTAIQFCNETIHPGETLSLALPLPELFSCAPLYMPIKVIHGKKAGPCLLITAAMHGDELNGSEIINRLMGLRSLNKLRGTLIAIPVLNVYGLINRSRYLPGGVDLDACFPGSETGNHGARLAHLFCEEIFCKADCCLDLRTGFINYANLPQLYIDFNEHQARSLAMAFNAPVISHASQSMGTLAQLAHENNTPFLRYEAGEAMRFDPHAITTGLSGIINLMRRLDMLPDKKTTKTSPLKSFFTQKNIWVRAPNSGMSYSRLSLGQHVKSGELLCVIKDPFGATDSIHVMSPEEGIIIGKNNLPLVYEGEELFQLAVFSKMQHAADHLEDWEEKSSAHFNTASGD